MPLAHSAQQAAPTKRSGTVRGRRDVRNTIFVPNPATPELTSIGETTVPPLPSSAGNAPTLATPLPAQPASPVLKQAQRVLTDEPAASDTQSVRSGRSLSSAGSSTIKHPDMHERGLNASLVETVSAWFEEGAVTKAMVIGQVALAYNPADLTTPFGSDSIWLDNFAVLEKVAPNPAFIEQVPDAAGSYTVDLAKITRTSVAFHYQVHLDSSSLAGYAPVVLSPTWKMEASQALAMVSYSLNPQFGLGEATSVTLRNMVLIVRLDGKATHCQTKPVGTFAREKNLIYWRLGDVTLSRDEVAQQQPHQLRARFFTDGEAKPGNSEARWEMTGAGVVGLGSGLKISQKAEPEPEPSDSEADPFADESSAAPGATAGGWKVVPTVKRICSGTYVGVGSRS